MRHVRHARRVPRRRLLQRRVRGAGALAQEGEVRFVSSMFLLAFINFTGFSSEIGTMLRDWAVGQAGGSCYSQAALSSNDSKTR